MNTSSVPNRRHKKLLREIDKNLSGYSLLNISAYIAIFIATASIGGMYSDFPRLTLILGAGFISLSLFRVLMAVRFGSIYAKGPGRWRKLFYLTALLQAVMWSFFLVVLVLNYGVHFNTFVAWLFTLAFISINLMVNPAYFKASKVFWATATFPPAITFLLQGEVTTTFIALLVIIYYLVLMKVSAKLYAQYWERIELQRAVNQRNTDITRLSVNSEKNNNTRDNFLSTLVHEVRTPISSVVGILSLLKDTGLDEVQSEYVSIASRAGSSLLELIEDILDFSQISTASLQLESSLFNLHNIIKNCVEFIGPGAHEKGVGLSYVCSPDLPARVIGDPDRLTQVLNNIVEYIVSKADQGEVVVTLTMDIVRADTGLLKVSVVDKNTVFSPEEQANLFYAFSSNDRRKRHRLENTRLGLAISKGLVGCMHGEVGVGSSNEKGCEVWFTAELGLSSQRYEPKKIDSALQNLRILAIGASEGVTQFLNSELSPLEAELEFVQDIKTAELQIASLLPESSYDLILLDMPLDNMDCLDFSAELAKNAQTEHIKQIVFSSLLQRGEQRVINHIEDYGSILFLTKPLRSQNLQDAIYALFGIQQRAVEPDDRIIFFDDSKNVRILLVEDDEINQMVTIGMLDKLGYSASVANDGREAVEMFTEQEFTLVLMDCLMPKMDGYEATEAIRQLETESHIPIIAITAIGDEDIESRCLASGMDDFLAKPVKLEELSVKIKHWLEKETIKHEEDDGIISMGQESRYADTKGPDEQANKDNSDDGSQVKLAH